MKIYLTTDTHFGHEKMKAYCDRPDNFEQIIFKNLQVVKKGDVIIHLGDFCIGRDEYWHDLFMELIDGKKWLIKGNHDGKSNSWYMDHGWDFVCSKFQDRFYGKNVLFSHTPVFDDREIKSLLYATEGFDINIHGHYHNNVHRSSEKDMIARITPKHRLLSIENANYKPVFLEEFIK